MSSSSKKGHPEPPPPDKGYMPLARIWNTTSWSQSLAQGRAEAATDLVCLRIPDLGPGVGLDRYLEKAESLCTGLPSRGPRKSYSCRRKRKQFWEHDHKTINGPVVRFTVCCLKPLHDIFLLNSGWEGVLSVYYRSYCCPHDPISSSEAVPRAWASPI